MTLPRARNEDTMTIYPRGILAFLVFAAMLAFAVYGRRTGVIWPAAVVAAAVAAMAIEILVFLGPALLRPRDR